MAGRFAGNLAQYLGPVFLFVSGDPNLRQSTGFGGELLVATLPLVVAGIVVCIRRWREPLPRFVVVGLVLAPVAAALTNQGTPHALRDATALPFWIAVTAYGIDGLRPVLRSRRVWVGVLTLAVAAETVLFTVDLFGDYPARSAPYFDSAQVAAVTRAHSLAGGHTVWLSAELEQGYIDACFVALPAPPRSYVGDRSIGLELAEARFREIAGSPARAPVHPGDLLVLAAPEAPPPGSVALQAWAASGSPVAAGAPSSQAVVRIWRAG